MESLHRRGHWSKKNIQSLLERMQNNLLRNGNASSQTTQSHLDWEKIAFKDFSAEMCKLKWTEISSKLKKIPPLTELVLQAKELFKNHNRNNEYKKYPDFPKRPLTAYIRFYKEQRAHYSAKHPELSNQELTKILAEKYKQLPPQTKQKYMEEFQKEKQEFEEKLAEFRKKYSDLFQNSKKLDGSKRRRTKAPKNVQGNVKSQRSPSNTDDFCKTLIFHKEPPKPPMNGYHKFHQDSWSSEELQHLPLRERMVEISRRWHRVPQNLREQYTEQAEELQKQYRVDLDLWLKTLSPEEYAAYKKKSYGKGTNMTMAGGTSPKFRKVDPPSPPAQQLPKVLRKEEGMEALETDSSETIQNNYHHAQGSKRKMREDGEEDEGSNLSDSSSGDEYEDGN
ncbi:upstream-binding factor 1-like protein 1 [Fukomys damarensis]|uniref:Putative upstream-binding factor 1-like protein 6 n=1 Tax=Fukomys damarensis TaxID=885580 RepID=A0A091DAV8_FUKDA|nr:upstream-binding factor 1-like protein 1 [Fukomys damarensis]KFO29234.1 Putative upstream-binding factor 1-like protein 6 [Fukomys damarensis]